MAGIPYVGATQSASQDLVTRGYASSLLGLSLPQATVDAQIAAALQGYPTKAYVDGQDALNATKAFVDAGDATRLKLSQVGINNGVLPLDTTGRVPAARVNLTGTQRYPKPYVTPAAYNSSAVTAGAVETQVFPAVSVPDPGFVYRLLVSGNVDTQTNTDGECAIIRVRQGSLGGPVVAGGYGTSELYSAGVTTLFSTVGNFTYTIPSWAARVDVVAVGAGGGGQGGDGANNNGQRGKNGSFATLTIIPGTTIAAGVSTLTLTITAGGKGGSPGNYTAGGATTVFGTGMANLVAAGGSGLGGASTVTTTFNGQTYVGGTAVSGYAMDGVPPGLGGNGGQGGLFAGVSGGGNGANGGVWFFAYPTPNVPAGPGVLIPAPLNAQSALTGPTKLYVTAQRSGTTSTQTISTLNSSLYVVPIPAAGVGVPGIPTTPVLQPGHIFAANLGFNQAELSLYGTGSPYPSSTDVPTVCTGIAATGAKWVRMTALWSTIQPSSTTFSWTAIDYAVAQAQAAGLNVLLALSPQSQWPSWATTPTQYAAFATALAQRYGPGGTKAGTIPVRAWEIGNEINSSGFWSPLSPSNYTSFLKPVYTALHAVDAGCTVMNGGFAADITYSNVLLSPVDYLTGMYTAGAHGYLDAVAYHPYAYNESTFADEEPTLTEQGMAWIPQLRTVMNNNGDGALPMWFTEIGFATQPNGTGGGQYVTPAMQATYLVEQIQNLVASYSPLGPMFIYNYRNSLSDNGASNVNYGYGVVNYDFSAKPALAAVKGIVQ